MIYNLYESNRQAGCVMYHYLAHIAHEIESFAAVVEVSKI
jgi:hypothetical protein